MGLRSPKVRLEEISPLANELSLSVEIPSFRRLTLEALLKIIGGVGGFVTGLAAGYVLTHVPLAKDAAPYVEHLLQYAMKTPVGNSNLPYILGTFGAFYFSLVSGLSLGPEDRRLKEIYLGPFRVYSSNENK